MGYSTPREVTRAVFAFSAVAGGDLRTSEIVVDLETAFSGWYRDTASIPFGSAFDYVQPFVVEGDRRVIRSVTLTLSNGQGNSNSLSATADFQ